MRMTFLALATLGVLSSVLTSQTVLAVPTAFPTIQSAIDAAVNGDRIEIAAGTYFENLAFDNLGIDIVGIDGAEVTIIDGQNAGPVFAIETASIARLDGLTIRGGRGLPLSSTSEPRAGGIDFNGIALQVSNCIIKDNFGGDGHSLDPVTTSFSRFGGAGGIRIRSGILGIFLVNSKIISNTGGTGVDGGPFGLAPFGGQGGSGGLDSIHGSAVTIEDSVFQFNIGGAGGDAGVPMPYGNGIAGLGGSGALTVNGLTMLIRTQLVSNVGALSGTGANFVMPPSDGSGGCTLTGFASLRAEDCLFAQNSAPLPGAYPTAGAIDGTFHQPTIDLVNCTVADNFSSGPKGALHLRDTSSMVNSLVSGNVPTSVTWPALPGPPSLSFCVIDSGIVGATILNATPTYLDPNQRDYRLTPLSAGVDFGSNSDVNSSLDLEGNPRTSSFAVDCGAYETTIPDCAQGNSPSATSPLFLVNGVSDFRQVIPNTQPVPLTFLSPPSQANSLFALFVKTATTQLSEETLYPFGIGALCFDAFGPDTFILISSFGAPLNGLIGFATAPWSATIPVGTPPGVVLTFQGFAIEGSSAIRSNAITLRFSM